MTQTKHPIKKHHLFAEIAGWYGAIAIICAYALSSFGVIDVEGIAYQLLNLTGALGIIAIAIVKHVKQSIILNIFWSLVALIALIRIVI